MFEASGEILLIAAVALIVLGPSKFPEIFRMFGKTVGEFRRMTADVKATLEREIERVEELKRIEETKNELFGETPNADPLGVAFGPGHAVDATPPASAPATGEPAQPAEAPPAAVDAAPEAADAARPAAPTVPTDAPRASEDAVTAESTPPVEPARTAAPSPAADVAPAPAEAAPAPAPGPTREELISQGFGTGHTFAPYPSPARQADQAAAPRDGQPATGQSQDKSHA